MRFPFSTTSTATKSASHARLPIRTAINHGFGDLHARDRKYPSDKAPNKVRGEGRVLTKMEKFNLKFGKCAQVFPGLSSLTTRFISGVSLLLLPNSISQCQDLDFP